MLCFLSFFFFQAIYNVWLAVNASTRRDYVGAALTSVSSLLMLMPSVRRRLIFPAAVTFARSILREGVPLKDRESAIRFLCESIEHVRSSYSFLVVAQSFGEEGEAKILIDVFLHMCFLLFTICIFMYSFKK